MRLAATAAAVVTAAVVSTAVITAAVIAAAATDDENKDNDPAASAVVVSEEIHTFFPPFVYITYYCEDKKLLQISLNKNRAETFEINQNFLPDNNSEILILNFHLIKNSILYVKAE